MNRSTGFTLIEVLVAVLVLAVGLLGLAGLQATGLKNNQSAYNRSQATQLAYDLADRMRANIAGIATYTNPASAASVPACLTTVGCSVGDMAANDLYEWNTVIGNTLPSGLGIVCLDSTPEDGTSAATACDLSGSTYAIKVWWDDDHSGAATQRFVTSFQL